MKTFGSLPRGLDKERINQSPNYNGKKFINPVPTSMKMDFKKIWKEYSKSRKIEKKPSFQVPVKKIFKEDFAPTPAKNLKVLWLGHSSTLVELNEVRILIDPILSIRASPFTRTGVKRLHETPLEIADIPEMDVILLSHNHYDHMDYPVIRNMADRELTFCIPLGVGATLKKWGINKKQIHEFDWYDKLNIKGVEFTSIPACHFSGRLFRDRDKTQWCSWGVKGKESSFFHSGDSGYFDGYMELGDRYGPFDISMVSIGSYNELWAHIHTSPEEAIKIHEYLKAKYLLPIHWATFNLALHSYIEPIERLLVKAKETKTTLLLPKPGEWVEMGKVTNWEYWWRK